MDRRDFLKFTTAGAIAAPVVSASIPEPITTYVRGHFKYGYDCDWLKRDFSIHVSTVYFHIDPEGDVQIADYLLPKKPATPETPDMYSWESGTSPMMMSAPPGTKKWSHVNGITTYE